MLIIYITIAITTILLLCTTKGQKILSIAGPELYDCILIIFIGLIWPIVVVFFIVGTLWAIGLSKILDKPAKKLVELILGKK